MAMGTWREDPVENRKLQEDSGLTFEKTVSGKDKPIEEVGKKKAFKPNENFYLSYPLERGRKGSEDSFLIQCVKYLPPATDKGLSFAFTKSATQAFTSGKNKDGVIEAFQQNEDGTYKQNMEFMDKTKSRITGAGMDSRVSELKQKTKFYVELPIPKQVNDGNSCVWSGNSMNLFTLAGLDLASGLMSRPGETLGMVQNVIDSMLKGGSFEDLGIGDGEEMQNAIRASLSGLAINQFGGNTTPNSVMSRGM